MPSSVCQWSFEMQQAVQKNAGKMNVESLISMTDSSLPMKNWTRGVYKADGIDIHYLRTGGDKPPLIALHGLTGSGACWAPLAHALESDYDVVMPDARGHGKSSAPLHGYMYRDHASDVIGLIEALGPAAPILLGHSMGGMTAAVVAS